MSRLLRTLWCASALLAVGVDANAQRNWSRVVVPLYSPAHLMQGLHREWMAPQADVLAMRSHEMALAIDAYCDQPAPHRVVLLKDARDQWRAATSAWERLSAVSIAPVLARRSLRQIDFTPTRPALIEKAIKAEPKGEAAMALVGTPAKGLPALEWLLWTQPAVPGTGACAYAGEVARDVEREAVLLQAAFKALADQDVEDWPEEAVVAAMNELVNQWVGGIERLRWAQMEKPLRAKAMQDLPRAASKGTQASWAAHWAALRKLAVFDGDVAPAPGHGLVPIETCLRSKGLNDLADRLVLRVGAVDAAMRAATPSRADKVHAAARALSSLKLLAESELAPALNVRMGFSDADGD